MNTGVHDAFAKFLVHDTSLAKHVKSEDRLRCSKFFDVHLGVTRLSTASRLIYNMYGADTICNREVTR